MPLCARTVYIYDRYGIHYGKGKMAGGGEDVVVVPHVLMPAACGTKMEALSAPAGKAHDSSVREAR